MMHEESSIGACNGVNAFDCSRRFDMYQNTTTRAALINRQNSYHQRINHMKSDDETETTVDETVDLNESISSFSLSSSLHSVSTSIHQKWRGSSNLYELMEDPEQSNGSSFCYEYFNESFSHNIIDWKVLRILGEGAFGQVAQVKRKSSGGKSDRCYALKVLSKYQILCDGQIDTVIAERSMLKEASAHPFVVKLKAAWQDANFVYMLQDFVQGGELYSLMLHTDYDSFSDNSDSLPIRRALPEHQVQFYTACIADALYYFHRKCKIVYRDLKPENVLLDSNGYPVLIDFGLAKRLSDENEYQTRTLCGTPQYIAPEQIQGAQYSFDVDYWALGILVYEMLTGIHPFDYWYGCDDFALYNSVTSEEYRPFSIEGASPSDLAKNFVDRLLIKDPSDRLGSLNQQNLYSRSAVQSHQWLSSIDERELRDRNILAPWIPEIINADDAAMFDDWKSSSNPLDSFLNPKFSSSLTSKEQERFIPFDAA